MRRTLSIFAALVSLAVFSPAPARAIEYPWCAVFGGDMEGASNCGFVSFEQCQGYIQGIGGFCERNQFYTGPATQPARKHRKRKRH